MVKVEMMICPSVDEFSPYGEATHSQDRQLPRRIQALDMPLAELSMWRQKHPQSLRLSQRSRTT